MARAKPPLGIDSARHQDLVGRNRHVWWRRGGLVIFAVIPVLALFDVFGQRTVMTGTQRPTASLLVNSPAHVRGGLVATTEIVISTRRPAKDARLFLDAGWFEGVTLNGITPQPSSESAQGRWQVWDFGQIPAGRTFRVWISWSANPTGIGRHSQDVALYDRGTRLMTIHRTLTVFP
jgi:hypothetical protein